MDPVTVAARQFLRALDRFWKRHPARIARLVAQESDHRDVQKALRLAEREPSNRRPLFVHDDSFESAEAYFDALCARLAADYARVREGASAQGVALAPLDAPPRSPALPPEVRAHAVAGAAALLLAVRLDGATVALMPRSIAALGEWTRSVDRLARMARPASLRIAVLDVPDGPLAAVLGEEAARYTLRLDDLFDYMDHQTSRRSEGPAVAGPPPLPTEVREELERSGRRPPRPEVAAALQAFFLKGARAAAKNDFKAAAVEYRRARDLCHDEGLRVEEAAAAFALAGAYLAAGSSAMAQATYGQAALLSAEEARWTMACQAKLGEAGTGWIERDFARAARAYSEAAALAERGDIALLRVEALRMEGHCHLERRAEPEAIRAWRTAVDVGIAAEEPLRRSGSFERVVTALADLLDGRGLRRQAAEVRGLLTGGGGS